MKAMGLLLAALLVPPVVAGAQELRGGWDCQGGSCQVGSLGVGTAADGTTGDIKLGNLLMLRPGTSTYYDIMFIDAAGNLNLASAAGYSGKGLWGDGADFESPDGSGADWGLTRSVLGDGNSGIVFGTVNVTPDTGIERTGVGMLTVRNTLAASSTGGMIPPINAIGSLVACGASTEGVHGVADNCGAGCWAGSTCVEGGTTHCEMYCNGTSYVETGR